MNKQTNSLTQRRLLAVLAGVGVVLGLSVSAFLASLSPADKTLAVDASSQTIEVQTTDQASPTTSTSDVEVLAPAAPSDGATVTSKNPITNKPTATVVDSSTRVKVTPKPTTSTPSQDNTQTVEVAPTPTQKASPTAGYIRPQVTFLGATACKPVADGWKITIAWKVSGGNFIGRFYGQNSGLKTPSDSWVITSDSEFGSTEAPTGTVSFRTDGDFIWFLAMNGDSDVIDEIWFADRTDADVTGLCR